MTSVTTNTDTQYTGRVKWFNKKSGFGFVTVNGGDRDGADIFVHHSNLNVDQDQYRYLVQGEYVTFTLGSTDGGDHEFQAVNVRGVGGGVLMCETQREIREFRIQRAKERGVSSTRGRGSRRGRGRARGQRRTNASTSTDTQTVEQTQ